MICERKILEQQILILTQHIEHPTKPGYRRHDILKTIATLESKLNLLKNGKNKITATVLTDEQIDAGIKLQAHNMKQFDDIFKEIDEVMRLQYSNKDEAQGALKACMLVKNHILNRNIDEGDKNFEKLTELASMQAIELGVRLDKGRDYLMCIESEKLTVEDCLEAFGFARNGLSEI